MKAGVPFLEHRLFVTMMVCAAPYGNHSWQTGIPAAQVKNKGQRLMRQPFAYLSNLNAVARHVRTVRRFIALFGNRRSARNQTIDVLNVLVRIMLLLVSVGR